MNKRVLVLVSAWLVVTALIAWSAGVHPDLAYEQFGVEKSELPYYWHYPAAVALCGAVLIAMLRPWRPVHSLAGSAGVFVLLAIAVIYLAITAMHQPLVHGHTFLLALAASQTALFYCGYAFASRQRELPG